MKATAWSQKNLKHIIFVIAALAVILAITLILISKDGDSPQNDLQKVVGQVGKHMVLPTNESPTLATVTNNAQLKDKFLAAKAKNGDRVLIYTKNQLVIIYRPGINKIAAVGAVSADPAYGESQGATLTILDSINDSSKTQEIIDKVKAAYPNIKITNGGKTERQDFPYTIVIDNTDRKVELRAALMKAVSGRQGFQPPSEKTPRTDLTIIVGLD